MDIGLANRFSDRKLFQRNGYEMAWGETLLDAKVPNSEKRKALVFRSAGRDS